MQYHHMIPYHKQKQLIMHNNHMMIFHNFDIFDIIFAGKPVYIKNHVWKEPYISKDTLRVFIQLTLPYQIHHHGLSGGQRVLRFINI